MLQSRKMMGLLTAGFGGFGLNAFFALSEKWSLPEFCWSTWLAALCFSWSCVVVGFIRVVLDAKGQKCFFEVKVPFLRSFPGGLFLVLLSLAAGLAAWVVFYLYCYLFSFYGILLSFFAEMTPHVFFGRNGFINSDFFSPVMFLVPKFWTMILGLILSNFEIFVRISPWRLLFLPFATNEILKIHILCVLMPFICLFAWILFKSYYQPITIIGLLGIFYLLPITLHREQQA